MEEISLDVIPIYKNETFPVNNECFHFVSKKEKSVSKETILEHMIEQIKYMFNKCDCVIVLEKGKVIEILIKLKEK